VKPHSSKGTRIRKDKHAVALSQQKVIVSLRREIFPLNAEFPGHTEVDSEPGSRFLSTAKPKEHLLRLRLGTEQLCTFDSPDELRRIHSAEDSRAGVEQHTLNARSQAGIPYFPVKLYLRELRHRCVYNLGRTAAAVT